MKLITMSPLEHYDILSLRLRMPQRVSEARPSQYAPVVFALNWLVRARGVEASRQMDR